MGHNIAVGYHEKLFEMHSSLLEIKFCAIYQLNKLHAHAQFEEGIRRICQEVIRFRFSKYNLSFLTTNNKCYFSVQSASAWFRFSTCANEREENYLVCAIHSRDLRMDDINDDLRGCLGRLLLRFVSEGNFSFSFATVWPLWPHPHFLARMATPKHWYGCKRIAVMCC